MDSHERPIREFLEAHSAAAPAGQKRADGTGKNHWSLELAMHIESEFNIILSDTDIDVLDRADMDAVLKTVMVRLGSGNGAS